MGTLQVKQTIQWQLLVELRLQLFQWRPAGLGNNLMAGLSPGPIRREATGDLGTLSPLGTPRHS